MKLFMRWWLWLTRHDEWDFSEWAGSEWRIWFTAQVNALKAGAEIEPPWIAFPGAEPWEFRQGNQKGWLNIVWSPFWERIRMEERTAYLDKWNAPQLWRETLPHSRWEVTQKPADAAEWYKDWPRLRLTGHRSNEEIEEILAGYMVDIAYVSEMTTDAVYIVADDPKWPADPNDYEWLCSCISGTLTSFGINGFELSFEPGTSQASNTQLDAMGDGET